MQCQKGPAVAQKGLKAPRPAIEKRQRNKAGLNAIRRIVTPLANLSVHFEHSISERPHADTIMVLNACRGIVDAALQGIRAEFASRGYEEVGEMIDGGLRRAEEVRADRSNHARRKGQAQAQSQSQGHRGHPVSAPVPRSFAYSYSEPPVIG
jgi:hypothetical protein